MKKFMVPILSTVVLSAVMVWLFSRINFMPVPAARQAAPVDTLLRILWGLTAVIFSLVTSFLVYSIVAFRRRPGDLTDAQPIHGNTPLEIAWTVLPFVIVLTLGGFGARALLQMDRRPTQPELVVEVTGVQWAWSFRYPAADVTTSELRLPLNQPILFRITSTDVIHSFWIPEFRVKTDAIPGTVNELRITPDRLGQYKVYCAELCGTSHAYMTAPAEVVEPAAFEAWLKAQQAAQAAAPDGEKIARTSGCLGCHTTDGSPLVGPTFKGVYNMPVTLAEGSTVTADEAYLKQSILNPSAQIVQGFPNAMPQDYGTKLSAEQIQALVEWIKGLK